MDTDAGREALRKALRAWGRQNRRRDDLVRDALAAGIPKQEIHDSTGIARSTIDRIEERTTDFDRQVTRFRQGMRRMRSDPQEAARIEAIARDAERMES